MALKRYLEEMTTSGHGMELPEFIKISGVKTVSRRKADMVDALYKYLSVEENIIDIWNNISKYERELISEYVRSEGTLEYKEIKDIMKKHNQKETSLNRFGCGMYEYFYDISKANLLFIQGRMPKEIYNILKKQVKPIKVEFTAVDLNIDKYIDNEKEYRKFISIREEFEKDFVAIIKLVNSSKFKTTKSAQMPNKTAMIKMHEVMKNKELFYENQEDIEDIRTIDKTIRLYGISKLLLESEILESISGTLSLGEHSDKFLMMNIAKRCKFLLDRYVQADIDELKRINEMRIRTQHLGNYSRCRKVILKYLKKLPIDKWINIEQFFKFIKKLDRNFLKKEVGNIYRYNDYEHFYYENSNCWEDETGRFIEVVLIEYLSTMGIVDLLIHEEWDDYGDTTYFRVDYLKLTPLGAHVIGVNKEYKVDEIKDETGIIIQPNYEIMVPEGGMKEVHCIYLDKFAEKLSEDTVSIYKISFKSMVRALDNEISIEKIIQYFEKFSHNEMPQNVLMSLNQWKEESKKIKIRTVTIVETNDKYLMEELKSYKTINKDIVNELPYVFEIDDKVANKVKRNIEKKNHFCNIE